VRALFILVLGLSLFASEIRLPNFNEAFSISISSKRPILLIVGKENCRYCEKLLSSLRSSRAIRKISPFFVLSYVDADNDFVPVEIAERTEAVPAIFFVSVSKRGDVVIEGGPVYGIVSSTSLISIAKTKIPDLSLPQDLD
jgi:thioredoxin-related protein